MKLATVTPLTGSVAVALKSAPRAEGELSRTLMRPMPLLVVITSGLPSLLRSATTNPQGLFCVGKLTTAWSVPSPLPRSTPMEPGEPELMTTTSSLPSALKSPTAAVLGLLPTLRGIGSEKDCALAVPNAAAKMSNMRESLGARQMRPLRAKDELVIWSVPF